MGEWREWIAPIVGMIGNHVDVKNVRFTAQDVWTLIGTAITITGLYYGMSAKLDSIAAENARKIDAVAAEDRRRLDLVTTQMDTALAELRDLKTALKEHNSYATELHDRMLKHEARDEEREREMRKHVTKDEGRFSVRPAR